MPVKAIDIAKVRSDIAGMKLPEALEAVRDLREAEMAEVHAHRENAVALTKVMAGIEAEMAAGKPGVEKGAATFTIAKRKK